MKRLRILNSALVGGASFLALTGPSAAKVFDIPDGDLAAALSTYIRQSGVQLIYMDNVRGHKSRGIKGDYTETAALSQLLEGTGFTTQTMPSNAVGIVPQQRGEERLEVAQAGRARAAVPASVAQQNVETVVVTAQKKGENIQQVPIAVSAFTQQQLTERQIAGGPDLVKEVPNLTFSKTNFTGYNIEIRGIGTQAISVTTDPAVAVAFNGTPFIRNHFFEQEFYDLGDLEVLRGPQGTLYGRNATAGVVNVKSALPTDEYEAMLSADLGNYSNRRLEGMLNIPVVGDKLDIRFAGEWTKRDGYTFNETTGQPVDGRDLWSGRVTIGWKPFENLQTYLIWEHFSEDDDRMRSAKQLCEKDSGPTTLDGIDLTTLAPSGTPPGLVSNFVRTWLSQGCLPTSLYSKDAFETPNGQALPFVAAGEFLFAGGSSFGTMLQPVDPYASQTQSTNLRVIQSEINPSYRAKNDTLEFNATLAITPELTITSQTGYNKDFLFSTEDFNRFDTRPGIFAADNAGFGDLNVPPDPNYLSAIVNGIYCDPQLGCSSSLVGEDLSQEHAWQFSQEVRLASSFSGPLNFSVGGNYLHYQTVEDYYVFFNVLSAIEQQIDGAGPGSQGYTNCYANHYTPGGYYPISPQPFNFIFRGVQSEFPSNFGCAQSTGIGTYIDPNSIDNLDGQGHNYFRSENPYLLNSLAGFGEAYYQATPDLKLTGGLRWTDDSKQFWNIPSQVFLLGGGYPVSSVVHQEWDEWTGRFVADWAPKLDFTDATLIYASYSHGYKGGGANPPGPALDLLSPGSLATHPPTFAPEHIEAFELGNKNTALDGALTFDGDVFFYNYHGYQISQIVDRTSINLNFNATVEGAELESTWEPLPGLKFNLASGWEDSAVDKNQYAIDLMDRTAGNPNWVLVRPYIGDTSNCILPISVVKQIVLIQGSPSVFDGLGYACAAAYEPPNILSSGGGDSAIFAAAGFDPATAPNGGAGIAKNLSSNKLPNMPPFTLSTGAQYSMPVSEEWLTTLRADFYWQGNTYARIFNDKPYDSIHGYTNLNLALMLDSQNGWDVMFYVKNVFDVTAITGAFLNSDDTALTTNVFVTDPRLIGVRVTKQLDQNDGFWGSDYSGYNFFTSLFSNENDGQPPLWIDVGGAFTQLGDAQEAYLPPFTLNGVRLPFITKSPAVVEKPATISWDGNAKIVFEPSGTDWTLSAGIRYGRSLRQGDERQQTAQRSRPYIGQYLAYQTVTAQNNDGHMLLDFQAGKDFGLGVLGDGGHSKMSIGLRYAQLNANSDVSILYRPTNSRNYYKFSGSLDAKRRFIGIGPSLSWDASADLLGNPPESGVAIDWGANGAVLFGRQHVRGHHQTSNVAVSYYTGRHENSVYQNFVALNRSKEVMVPNLGAFAGVSWRYQNAKISFGYRADEFFGAMDGGTDTRRSENVGFFGPYANVSIGLGG